MHISAYMSELRWGCNHHMMKCRLQKQMSLGDTQEFNVRQPFQRGNTRWGTRSRNIVPDTRISTHSDLWQLGKTHMDVKKLVECLQVYPAVEYASDLKQRFP